MSSPSLGYQPDSTISKQRIAELQLKDAISLFINGNFVSSLTLAGAAEAILAGLLNCEGKLSVVESSVSAIEKIRDLGLNAMNGRPKNSIFNEWNNARNEFKHHNKNDDDVVVVNLFDESYWMISRALENADNLKIIVENRDEFENWVIINLHL